VLDKARRCAINEALAKANIYYTPPTKSGILNTPTESSLLKSKIDLCVYNYSKPPVPTESVRIAALMQSTRDKEQDPTNSFTRFAEYGPRIIIPPCPPIDPAVLNGNLPKNAKSCPLPNTPLNPTLPV
jgi:hypothetical protein